MIDWVTILLALGIIAGLVGGFGFVAWKINMSDPLTTNFTGKKDDTSHLFDSVNDKKKKDKNGNDSKKKKRNVQKKPKRDNNEEEEERHVVKFKEPSTQTSEETDNEREESEQESPVTQQVVETSSKARKRKNKTRTATPPRSSSHIEGILANKDEKSPVTARAPPMSHPKLATAIPKDEVELAKQHQQQAKAQIKPLQSTNKQTVPTPPVPVKKSVPPSSTNVNQGAQKQQHQQQQQEQPFTTVVGKGHKTVTPPVQQQQQQQQTKLVSSAPLNAAAVLPPPAQQQQQQQQAPAQVPHEQLAQRQPPRQQKETLAQLNGFNTNPLPIKQPAVATPTPASSASPVKLADLVKALPTSQVVVTELMSALDAFPLSTDELDIIMQKIANKQSVIKRDWTKLQHGQKVDPQAHIGQVLDESAKAYEEDMKNNAMKHIKDLTDELNNDKRRINDLVKETADKDINIQLLRSQLNSLQHPQQQIHTYEPEYRRLMEENMQLKQRLAQTQQHFQQQQQHQQLSSLNLINNNNSDLANAQARVLNDQMKKLSIDNGKLEKQLDAKEALFKDMQKEKDDLIRVNQQLVQKAQEGEKQFRHNEKLLKELNESRTVNMNQLGEYKRRIDELEANNEQLRRAEVVRVEPTITPSLANEERDKFEQEISRLKQQLTGENEQYQKKLDEIQTQQQSQENQLRQEIEQLKNNTEQRQREENLNNELKDKNAQLDAVRAELKEANDTSVQMDALRAELEDAKAQNAQMDALRAELEDVKAKNAQMDVLRTELEDAKAKNDAIHSELNQRLQQEQEKQKQFLSELLDQDVRNQLPNDNQDFNQWLSSYKQISLSSIETGKRAFQAESDKLKLENDQLHKNMNDVESHLKQIEQTVQSKEETLLADLRSKDAILESIHSENDQLNGEIRRLRTENDRLQLAHESAIKETQVLQLQLDERAHVTGNSSSLNADESFEFIKHSPLPPPTESNTRIDQLQELIRSGKEALENQDSIVQQLDKHLNDMHRGGAGETSTSNVDESTVSSSSPSVDQSQPQPQPQETQQAES